MSIEPQAFIRRTVRARKDHRCCECGNPIRKGFLYERVNGIWEDKPDSFKTCMFCAYLRRRALANLLAYEDCPAFGELREWLGAR